MAKCLRPRWQEAWWHPGVTYQIVSHSLVKRSHLHQNISIFPKHGAWALGKGLPSVFPLPLVAEVKIWSSSCSSCLILWVWCYLLFVLGWPGMSPRITYGEDSCGTPLLVTLDSYSLSVRCSWLLIIILLTVSGSQATLWGLDDLFHRGRRAIGKQRYLDHDS